MTISRPVLRPLAALLAAVLVTTLGACGASDGSAAPAPAPTGTPAAATVASLLPGDAVPPPTGRVVLVVRGGTTTNVGDELHLDLDQLEALGTVEHTIDDAMATGRTATFSGPRVRDLLAVAGAGDATTMHTIALNDYVADVPVSDAAEMSLIVATRMDGEPMSVADYGPTRFVYPTDEVQLDQATYEPRWVWQLATIELS